MDDPHREAREAAVALYRSLGPEMRVAPSLEALTIMGKSLWPYSYGAIASDAKDLDAYDRLMDHLKKTDPLLASGMLIPGTQILTLWSVRWADQGFPVIQLGHRYASSLMATGLSRLDAEHVVAPFKAFCIQIPDGLLTTEHEGKPIDFRWLFAHQAVKDDEEIVWNLQLMSLKDISLWRHGVPTEMLCDEELPAGQTEWGSYSFALPKTDRDDRIIALAGRLLLGVCLAMSSPDNTRPVGKGHRYDPGQLRELSEPLHRTYQVGAPIKLDVRDEIRRYVEGTDRKAPSVQVLVRGHWRRVVVGKREEGRRRWRQIEPYWKGREDAPILVRPMKIGPDEE
jgi:hypothetical protein